MSYVSLRPALALNVTGRFLVSGFLAGWGGVLFLIPQPHLLSPRLCCRFRDTILCALRVYVRSVSNEAFISEYCVSREPDL